MLASLTKGVCTDASTDIVAAVAAGDEKAVEALLAGDPACAAARDEHGVSVVLLALYHGHVRLAALIASRRPHLDLFEAAALGDLARLEALADRNTVRSLSPDGFTALHLAAFFHQEDAARLLLERGADPAAVAANPMLVQPLHSAVAARERGIARLLLEAGAPAGARQQRGYTPLHAAAQHGDHELACLLIRHGADAGAADDDGLRAADRAREAGHLDLAAQLAERAEAV
jgi:uncharacterized protein